MDTFGFVLIERSTLAHTFIIVTFPVSPCKFSL